MRACHVGVVLLLYAAAVVAIPAAADQPSLPPLVVGFTLHATDLPGGRLANVATSRAMLLPAGRQPVPLASRLADERDSWTQFVGWLPDGRTAIVGRGWESRDNAAWEEEHREFRFRAGDWLYDCHLVDIETGQATNVTAVDRASFHNTGLFSWPGDAGRLGFTALVDGVSKPFAMGRDGRNKTDLAATSRGFAYGFSGSPDGTRIAYHENYQIWLADADGSNRQVIATGNPFNFAPSWSPDGRRLLFLSGEHYDCHPHVVRADGTGLVKLADRRGYRGVMEFLDVPDFHGGSSDVPVWSQDGRRVFYTARVAPASTEAGETIELFAMSADGAGEPVRLTHSPAGTLHYHPRPSPDGDWLLYGSHRGSEGGGRARNLFALRLADGVEVQLTRLPPGQAAMHGHWQPVASVPGDAVAVEPGR